MMVAFGASEGKSVESFDDWQREARAAGMIGRG